MAPVDNKLQISYSPRQTLHQMPPMCGTITTIAMFCNRLGGYTWFYFDIKGITRKIPV